MFIKGFDFSFIIMSLVEYFLKQCDIDDKFNFNALKSIEKVLDPSDLSSKLGLLFNKEEYNKIKLDNVHLQYFGKKKLKELGKTVSNACDGITVCNVLEYETIKDYSLSDLKEAFNESLYCKGVSFNRVKPNLETELIEKKPFYNSDDTNLAEQEKNLFLSYTQGVVPNILEEAVLVFGRTGDLIGFSNKLNELKNVISRYKALIDSANLEKTTDKKEFILREAEDLMVSSGLEDIL